MDIYQLMEGNVAGPWLATTGCVVPDAQLRSKSRLQAMDAVTERARQRSRCFENWVVFTKPCCQILRFIMLRKLAREHSQANGDVDSQRLACEG